MTAVAPLLNVADVARLLSVSSRTVQLWAKQGVLTCFRFGAIVRFDPDDVRRFVEEKKTSRRAG
jgi:excisionase family DNA binding protein